MEKVLVGMSGGVDSAVAAYLLKKAGYEVIGVTLRTWQAGDGPESRCCDIDDARSAAEAMGIRFFSVNCITEFQRYVAGPFVQEYLHGRTPNPCIGCNSRVKWEKLLYYSKVLGAEHIATGHYASIIKLDNGRYTVKKALHSEKDQSYMLYRLSQEQLAATLMPLGDLSKSEVRRIAADAGLPVASKPDSQEICFVSEGNYADYIRNTAIDAIPGEGTFIDASGNMLGKHKGIINYTVGQRKGLGIALGYPAYVREIRPDTNEVVLGDEQSLYSSELICRDLSFTGISGMEKGRLLECTVKIRYGHSGQRAVITMPDDDIVKVRFAEPVRAAAPGQSAVFYDDEGCILGGGIIYQAKQNTEH